MCMCMRMHMHVCMCMYAYAQVTPALLSAAVDEPISRPRDDFSPPEVDAHAKLYTLRIRDPLCVKVHLYPY